VLVIGLVGILIAAPSASGQAAIDQYVPQGNPAGGPGGTPNGQSGSLGPGGAGLSNQVVAEPKRGSSGGGTLPFTGYPVTPFIWVIVAALIAGALVRLAAPVLERGWAKGA
jgi:hypothetical protein